MALADALERLRVSVGRVREQLARVRPGYEARLLRLASQARRELRDRLEQLDPTRFQAQATRVVLLEVEAVIDDVGRRLGVAKGDTVEALGREAAGLALGDLEAQLAAWAPMHPAAERVRARAAEAALGLDDGLLEYYRTSRARYGLRAIADMRDALAVGLLQSESVAQVSDRLAAALSLEPYRAERIVRTEQSFAFHRQWDADTRELLGEDAAAWRRELVAIFDRRTAPDSRFVHGQRRRFGEPFRDNEGRVYLNPPNRPNDRETVILVPAEVDPAELPESERALTESQIDDLLAGMFRST